MRICILGGYWVWNRREGLTTLSGNDTTFTQGTVEKLEIWFLEQRFGGALRVGRVSDDDVELVLLIFEELEAIANDGLGLGVLEPDGHSWEVFLGETDDSLQCCESDAR